MVALLVVLPAGCGDDSGCDGFPEARSAPIAGGTAPVVVDVSADGEIGSLDVDGGIYELSGPVPAPGPPGTTTRATVAARPGRHRARAATELDGSVTLELDGRRYPLARIGCD